MIDLAKKIAEYFSGKGAYAKSMGADSIGFDR